MRKDYHDRFWVCSDVLIMTHGFYVCGRAGNSSMAEWKELIFFRMSEKELGANLSSASNGLLEF